MVSWTAIQTLLLCFGPLIFQQGRAWYARTRTTLPPVALPRRAKHLLDVLFFAATLSLLLTLPRFAPENIFTATQSRLLQTPTDVLFTRLSRNRALTPADTVLRARLASRDARLLYAALGPRPLTECGWCVPDSPATFVWYALPALLLPHAAHAAVLGAVTSRAFSRCGPAWRTPATLAALAVLAAELWLVVTGARGGSAVMWPHWRARVLRGVAFAAIDAALACALYFSATRRWAVGWDAPAAGAEARLESALHRLQRSHALLRGAGLVRQAAMRDAGLRASVVAWWTADEATRCALAADEAVAAVRRDALPARLDMAELRRNAAASSRLVIGSMTAS